MKRTIVTSLVSLALALPGCNDKPASEGVAPAASQAMPVADTDLTVPADFEEKAAAEITTDNYQKELDKIKAEIKR